jgi:hypothetical protein
MSRFLISVALLVGLSFAVSSAAPLQTYAQVAAEGPRCASPTNPDKTMNCAVMLQMAGQSLLQCNQLACPQITLHVLPLQNPCARVFLVGDRIITLVHF